MGLSQVLPQKPCLEQGFFIGGFFDCGIWGFMYDVGFTMYNLNDVQS